MATVTSWAGAQPSPHAAKEERRALSHSMEGVLREIAKLRESPNDEDVVHDLRVSIRRCRSIASVMEEVDPEPAWLEMRRTAKKLFHGLGEIGRAHV